MLRKFLLVLLASSLAAEDRSFYVNCTVKAYSAFDSIDADSPWRDGITAAGTDTSQPGDVGVAAAFAALPIGTMVQVEGYDSQGWVPVDDTGGFIRRAYRDGELLIELRMPSEQAALQWGAKRLKVRILLPAGVSPGAWLQSHIVQP